MTDITLDTITALNNAYPKTQYVDYSGFIDAFQPVLNDPSMYVPQQGLLQNTPTLADITLDPTIGAYSPVVTGLLQAYPQMEQDFQSTFAVDPNTYRNFETYRRLPFDKSYWENVVGGSGSGGDGLDLGGVAAAGTVASTIVNGGGTTTSGTDTTGTNVITVDGTDGTDGSSGTDGTTGTTITLTGGTNTSGTSTTDGSQGTEITLSSSSDSSDSDTVDGSQGSEITLSGSSLDDTSSSDTVDGGQGTEITLSGNTLTDIASNDTIDGGAGSEITLSANSSYSDIINSVDATNSTTAANDITNLANIGILSGNALTTFSNLIGNGVPLKTAIGTTISSSSGGYTDVFKGSTINLRGTNPVIGGQTITLDTGFSSDPSNILGTTGQTELEAISFDSSGFSPDFKYVDVYENGVKVGEKVVQKNWFDKQFDKFGNFLDNPINQGFGEAGTAFNDATQFTGAEAISLGGGLLSLASALDEATPSNVFGTVAGIGASGLLGGTATTTTGTSLMAANAKAAVTGASTAGAGMTTTAGTGIQGAMTASWVAPLAVALFIGEKLQADPSNKTGFGQYDAGTGETTSFGMEGDKFKQKNVDASTSIASAMGGAVNNITDAFGLTAEGDILAQTGNRDPLNITYGNQESEATTNDRLNYNTESGDIQSGDGIERWYYTGKDGFDGARLTSDLVHGTALLSLKAKANGEDSIDLANMTLPSRSADDVKNTYLSQGLDEVAADALTSAARSASGATSELLGGLLLANTTNEANYLTPTERESLIEQGFTNEQLDTMLYGTTNDSLLAINELLANDKQAPLPSTEEILLKEQHEKELALQLAKKENIIAD